MCYEYVLLHVDDALAVSEDAESLLRNELGRYFEMKEEFIGPSGHYLEAKLGKSNLKMMHMHGHSVHPNMLKQQSRMSRNICCQKAASTGKCQITLTHP